MIVEQWKRRLKITAVGIAASCFPTAGLMRDAFVNEIYDVLRGGAGEKNLRDAGLLQGRDVGFGDDSAEDYGHIVHPFIV